MDDNQKSRLEGLFLAPKAVAALLRAYPKPLVTKADASLFLLSNRKALDGYINPDARGHSVDLLTELLLQWSGNPPETVGIDFDDVSLTQDHKVYLPLDGLRNLEVENVQELLSQRKGRRFKQPFTVFEKNKQFFIALTLEPIQVPRVAPSAPAKMPQARATAQTTKSPIALKPLEPAPPPQSNWIRVETARGVQYQDISSPTLIRAQVREPRQRVLFSKFSGVFGGGHKAMNWGGLSGWGVNGGLPSLGKRSR